MVTPWWKYSVGLVKLSLSPDPYALAKGMIDPYASRATWEPETWKPEMSL